MFRAISIFGALAVASALAQSELPQFGDSQLTWSGKLRVALQTDPGHAYAVQESTDLETWSALPGDPSVSSLLTFPASDPTRFYRAVRVATNPDFIPTPVVLPGAPTNMAAKKLTVWTAATQASTSLTLWGSGTFTASDPGLGLQRGAYAYRSDGIHAQLWLNSFSPPEPRNVIELEFTDSASGIVRAWIGAALTETSGTFSLEQMPPPIPPPPTLSQVMVAYDFSGFGSARFAINLTGGASGTFAITGESVGQGVYTYAPGATSARLFLTYTDFPGDTDDFILTFFADGTHRIEGTQIIVGFEPFRAEGFFTYTP